MTARTARLRRLVGLVAREPDEHATWEQYLERHHLDLADKPLRDVLLERDRIRTLILLAGRAAPEWYCGRLRALEARLRNAR